MATAEEQRLLKELVSANRMLFWDFCHELGESPEISRAKIKIDEAAQLMERHIEANDLGARYKGTDSA